MFLTRPHLPWEAVCLQLCPLFITPLYTLLGTTLYPLFITAFSRAIQRSILRGSCPVPTTTIHTWTMHFPLLQFQTVSNCCLLISVYYFTCKKVELLFNTVHSLISYSFSQLSIILAWLAKTARQEHLWPPSPPLHISRRAA